jgi:outer membrane protein assembly factor BamD (BamD/ComL family)
MKRENAWFAIGLAIIIGVFAIVIFRGPTDVSDTVIAQSQQHYEVAQKAVSEGNLELAMSHLEAIEKRTPAWYESRELHWKVKEELNTYARAKQ